MELIRDECNGVICLTNLEEIVKKITMKELREEAKKRGIPTSCVTKLKLAEQLPEDVLEELASKKS
ncbi:MAG: hypothetical protein ACXQTM_05950 [Methanosarcinales archaeon]